MKTVTIKEIENEEIEFEHGIWTFLAPSLFALRKKLRLSLISIPNYGRQQKKEAKSKKQYKTRWGFSLAEAK